MTQQHLPIERIVVHGPVYQLLQSLSLTHYCDIFVQHELTIDVIRELNDAEWATLALPLGARKRIQQAVQQQTNAQQAPPTSPQSPINPAYAKADAAEHIAA